MTIQDCSAFEIEAQIGEYDISDIEKGQKVLIKTDATRDQDGKKCYITIKTKENFSLQRMKGDNWKKEHVLDLPFSYFFPQRLCNPTLAEGQTWDVAVDENFLLVYTADFEPNSTYEVVLDLNAE